MKIVLALLLLLILPLCGCASLKERPALRTALIATGSALVGYYAHKEPDQAQPAKHLRDPDCKGKDDCR